MGPNFIITGPADVPAPSGVRQWAGTLWTRLKYFLQMFSIVSKMFSLIRRHFAKWPTRSREIPRRFSTERQAGVCDGSELLFSPPEHVLLTCDAIVWHIAKNMRNGNLAWNERWDQRRWAPAVMPTALRKYMKQPEKKGKQIIKWRHISAMMSQITQISTVCLTACYGQR